MEGDTQTIQQPNPAQPVMQTLPRHGLPLFFKILFVLVGIVVLFGLLTGAYILGERQGVSFSMDPGNVVPPSRKTPTPTPTLDPTANWKTYTDPKYNFTIKYPADYATPQVHVSPDTFSNNSLYQVDIRGGLTYSTPNSSVTNNPNESYGDGLRIEVFSNPQKLSAADYVNRVAFVNDLPQWNNKNQPRQIVHLLCGDAVRIETLSGGAGGYGPVVFVSGGSVMYEVEATGLQKTITSVFNQAILTLNFAQ